MTEQILEHVAGLPEGVPVSAKALLHLGSRAAVKQTLSRLARRGRLLRAVRGLYVRPVSTRFGSRSPSVDSLVRVIAGFPRTLSVKSLVPVPVCRPGWPR
ncbi:MAG: DUF6088 family protein [Sphingobium sp.]